MLTEHDCLRQPLQRCEYERHDGVADPFLMGGNEPHVPKYWGRLDARAGDGVDLALVHPQEKWPSIFLEVNTMFSRIIFAIGRVKFR